MENKTNCYVKCPYHSGLQTEISNVKENLEKEIQERKRVYKNFQEFLDKQFTDNKSDIYNVVKTKLNLSDNKIENFETNLQLKFEGFRKEMESKIMDFKKITVIFFVATITLWGSVIGLMTFLFHEMRMLIVH